MKQYQLTLFGDRPISCFEDKKVFGEFNIEKYANVLFPPIPAGSSELQEPVIYEFRSLEITEGPEAGTKYRPSLELHPGAETDRYTTDTHDVLYGLYKTWELQGKPEGAFEISLRSIAKTIAWGTGRQPLEKVKRALASLYSTEVHFKACFEINTTEGEITKTNTKRFRVLARYDTSETIQNGELKRGAAWVEFSSELLNSLLSGKLMPVNMVARMSIKHDLSRAVYGVYDTYLTSSYGKNPAGNNVREIKIKNLCRDFKATVPKYKSGSKKIALKIVSEINGSELSREGLFMNVDAKETADGKDYKLVFSCVGVATKKFTKVAYINDESTVDSVMASAQEMIGDLQSIDTRSMKALRNMMKKTDINIVYNAISELKLDLADGKTKPRSTAAYLMGIIKRKVKEVRP